MKTNVTVRVSESGCDVTIINEPWASCQSNINGLLRAPGAKYRGVQFTRQQQNKLGYVALMVFCLENWDEVRDAGKGILDITPEILEKVVETSRKIDKIVETAVPAMQYQCAEIGCEIKVSDAGDYCSSCEFDR